MCIINDIFEIVPTINFNQSTYSVDEDDGPAQPVLVLSNPISLDIIVQVRDSSGTAARKLSINIPYNG